MTRRALTALFALAGLTACQHSTEAQPAVLAEGSAESISALKSALGEAMGRATIELGATDPTEQPMVSVLPVPLHSSDDRSNARPIVFDLILHDGECIAIRRDTQVETKLSGVDCRPV